MKYLAFFFIITIIATTLVSSNALSNTKEVRQCNPKVQREISRSFFLTCDQILATATPCLGSSNLGDYCDCCRTTLGGNVNRTVSEHYCCTILKALYYKSLQCQNDPNVHIPEGIKSCNITGRNTTGFGGNTSGGGENTSGSAATTTLSYFTGLLLLLTAVAYQFLF